MIHRNETIIVGKIGKAIKYARAQNGNSYAYVCVECEAKDGQQADDRLIPLIHVSTFKSHLVKYLKDVDAKVNDTIIVFGFISSYGKEIKGQNIISNNVVANALYIAKKPITNNNENKKEE